MSHTAQFKFIQETPLASWIGVFAFGGLLLIGLGFGLGFGLGAPGVSAGWPGTEAAAGWSKVGVAKEFGIRFKGFDLNY